MPTPPMHDPVASEPNRLDAAAERGMGLQEVLTCGTVSRLATHFALGGMWDNRLAHATRELLTQRPDSYSPLGQSGSRLL